MLKTTNIRALKDRLSAFLRDVQRGDVILVTDRGRVVAEIRSPTVGSRAAEPPEPRARRLVEEGALKLGLPNAADAYRRPGLSLPDAAIDDALAWTRGDR
jgi:antitoxin (DNA-binding transcriptional repressor) of toxin-antitoxin stability system